LDKGVIDMPAKTSAGGGGGGTPPTTAQIAAAVWALPGRSLDIINNIATAIWAFGVRRLSDATNITSDNLPVANNVINNIRTSQEGVPASGTMVFDETNAGLQAVLNLTGPASTKIWSLVIDANLVTQFPTNLIIYRSVNGGVERIDQDIFSGINAAGIYDFLSREKPYILLAGEDITFYLQCGGGGAGNVNIPYDILIEVMN
jgi:hypothetical protein